MSCAREADVSTTKVALFERSPQSFITGGVGVSGEHVHLIWRRRTRLGEVPTDDDDTPSFVRLHVRLGELGDACEQ